MDLSDEEALDLTARIVEWYKQANKKKRLGRVIDEVGLDTFKADLGLPTG